MEASGALGQGQGAADGGQADAQGQQQGEGQQGGQDFGQLMDTLSQLSQGQEEMRQFLAGQPWQPEPEQQEEQTPTFEYGDPNDPAWDEQAEQERLAQYVQQLAQQQVQQHLAPINDQLRDVRMSQEADQLVAEFPELGDPEVANEVAGPNGVAAQYANLLGRPELAQEPKFWRLVYLAGRATEAANEEGAETPDAARLEGSGAAGAQGQQPNLAEIIMNRSTEDDGGLGGRVLNFG